MSRHGGLLIAFANDNLDDRRGKEARRCDQRVEKTSLPRWEVRWGLRHLDMTKKGRRESGEDGDDVLLEELEARALLCWGWRIGLGGRIK